MEKEKKMELKKRKKILENVNKIYKYLFFYVIVINIIFLYIFNINN